jgi:hypothetical protein
MSVIDFERSAFRRDRFESGQFRRRTRDADRHRFQILWRLDIDALRRQHIDRQRAVGIGKQYLLQARSGDAEGGDQHIHLVGQKIGDPVGAGHRNELEFYAERIRQELGDVGVITLRVLLGIDAAEGWIVRHDTDRQFALRLDFVGRGRLGGHNTERGGGKTGQGQRAEIAAADGFK